MQCVLGKIDKDYSQDLSSPFRVHQTIVQNNLKKKKTLQDVVVFVLTHQNTLYYLHSYLMGTLDSVLIETATKLGILLWTYAHSNFHF